MSDTKLAQLIAQREGFGIKGAIPTTHNNPGDLRHSPHSTHPADAPNSIGQIDTPAHGWEDLEEQLQKFAARNDTLQQLVYIYAPPADANNSAAYLDFVCKGLGCQPTTLVSDALKIPGGPVDKTQWQKSSPIIASAGTGTMLATLVIAALTHYAQLDMSPDVKSSITGLCIAVVAHFFHGTVSG